ncbi:tRNA pseudouridine(38-40) synthase TruA [bacterium]|nr:tRNA pseudouridine(38-40) synthase TruA [bacterium]
MLDNTSDEQPIIRRIRCRVSYDGSGYAGWQFQPGAATVQGALETALLEVTGETVRVTGAGRTDAGVHSVGQVAHWDSRSVLEPAVLERALNARLPEDIRVRQLGETVADFHARFSATARQYRYRITERQHPESVLERNRAWLLPLGRLDFESLDACAAILPGEHDFSAFQRGGSDTAHNRCRIDMARWERDAHGRVFHVQADRFLRSMVRMLVGAMVAVSEGKASHEEFTAALDEKSHWMRAVPAPACGLTLVRVDYPSEFNFDDNWEDS